MKVMYLGSAHVNAFESRGLQIMMTHPLALAVSYARASWPKIGNSLQAYSIFNRHFCQAGTL